MVATENYYDNRLSLDLCQCVKFKLDWIFENELMFEYQFWTGKTIYNHWRKIKTYVNRNRLKSLQNKTFFKYYYFSQIETL